MEGYVNSGRQEKEYKLIVLGLLFDQGKQEKMIAKGREQGWSVDFGGLN